jgi:hypothetical protein
MNLPPGYVAYLPPARHILDDAKRIAADVSPSGFEQVEKTCRNCGATRITMIKPEWPYRAWRRTPDGPQIQTDIAPPCNPEAEWRR